ncbi:hypothetical protein C0992_005262 [Termitomyces sp. T32_za158]|nr:hypothetical protein C0992_005262 [Termitomyces sp. T32_za158]
MLNLTSGLHGSFDSNHWAFLPLDIKFLASLLKWSIGKVKGPIESFYKKQKQELFNYALLPLSDMDTCIARRNRDKLQEPPSKTNLPQDHYFPYATLPPLKSHIRPHFVIVNLMRKVRHLEEKIEKPIAESEELSSFFEEHESYEINLGSCEYLFNIWMGKVVPDHFRGNNAGSLISSGGEGHGDAGDAGPRGGRDQNDDSGNRKRSRSRVTASTSGSKNMVNTGYGQHRHSFAFPASAPEDLMDVWDGDEIGLRPIDSVTYTSDQGHGGTDNDDEFIEFEESDYALQERVSRWVASVDPILGSPHHESMPVDDEQWTDLPFDDGQHDSDGSPTMVGSLLLQFKNHEGSVDPTLITTRLLGKADQTTSQTMTIIDSRPIDVMFVEPALASA